MKSTTLTRKYALLLLCIFTLILFVTALDLTSFAFAEEVSNAQIIKLEYLKRIDDTPFAEKVQAIIKVPVYTSHKIKVEDVKKALKCKAFGVMQSYCDTFTYNVNTDTYTAVYKKSVYLNAKTVDGNSKNFYLDCNMSFGDYFSPFVKSGMMEADAFEVFSNGIQRKYPVLVENDYNLEELYGYFGLIPIPRSYSLNQLFADMFGSTTFSGVLEHFTYHNSLSKQAYRELLEDYQYGWLEIVWNSIWNDINKGSANATYYMIYVDSETTEAFIAENGATSIDDNSGAIWVGIKGLFTNSSGTWKTILAVLGGIVVLGVLGFVTYLIIRFGKTVNKTVTSVKKKKKK